MDDSKENRKTQIIEAAKKIFARYGFSKTTLEDIGEAVGMKKNSLYHYFANKEELFNTIINDEAVNYFEKLERTVSEKEKSVEKLKTTVLLGMKYSREKANLYKATVSAKLDIENVIFNFYHIFIQKQTEIIKRVLLNGIQNKEFEDHNYERLSVDIVDMVNALEARKYQTCHVEFLNQINFEEHDEKVMNLLNYIISGIQMK